MKPLCVILFSTISVMLYGQSHPIDASQQEQFNFWIGHWDVDLSVIQPDNTWEIKANAETGIYPVVGGRGVMELWDHDVDGIIGFSFRYFNSETQEWDLWLNWPGKNRSGTNGLTGNFNHGRGEFFSTSQINDSTEMISRYTFSDITPTSIRWDDGYSKDGGKTWASNWIMEFNRLAESAPQLSHTNRRLTVYNGNRCDLAEFEDLKILEGAYTNDTDRLNLYQILDGCSIVGLVGDKAFFTLTYNTYAQKFELGYFDEESTSIDFYYGVKNNEVYQLQTIDSSLKSAKIDTSNGFELELTHNSQEKVWKFSLSQ